MREEYEIGASDAPHVDIRHDRMNPIFRRAKDKGYVERLTRTNMAPYYEKAGLVWDRALFEKNWQEFESYEVAINGGVAGVLRLSHDDVAYYIRDLQIEPSWQHQGLGTRAINFAIEIARNAGAQRLRLRVFCENPAVALYERMGFQVCKTAEDTHYMERELP
ncbi:GNAT family N-acetyltransferase [Onishia taeanensis]|nr:GNAT family N-acetyltransferase [Halomonas taeanensis]